MIAAQTVPPSNQVSAAIYYIDGARPLAAAGSTGSLGSLAGYLTSPATGTRTVTGQVDACGASAQALVAIKTAILP